MRLEPEAFAFNLVAQCDLSSRLSIETKSVFQYELSEPPGFHTQLGAQCDLSGPLNIESDSEFQYGLSSPPQRLHCFNGSM